jgi:hypothetical protein
MRDQPIGIRCILRIYYSIESKWDHPFNLIKAVKENTYHLQDMFFLRTSLILITQITLRYTILNGNVSLILK